MRNVDRAEERWRKKDNIYIYIRKTEKCQEYKKREEWRQELERDITWGQNKEEPRVRRRQRDEELPEGNFSCPLFPPGTPDKRQTEKESDEGLGRNRRDSRSPPLLMHHSVGSPIPGNLSSFTPPWAKQHHMSSVVNTSAFTLWFAGRRRLIWYCNIE